MRSAARVSSLLLFCTAQRAFSLSAAPQIGGSGETPEQIRLDLERAWRGSDEDSTWPWSKPSASPPVQPAEQFKVHADFFETEAEWNEEKGRLEAQLEASQVKLKNFLGTEQFVERAAKQAEHTEAKRAKAVETKQAALDAAVLRQATAHVAEQARTAKADRGRVQELRAELAAKQLELNETVAKEQKLQADMEAKQLELDEATRAEQEAERMYQDSQAQKLAKEQATTKTEAELEEAELDIQVQQQLKVLKMREAKQKLEADVDSKQRELREFVKAGWKHRG